MSMQPNRVPPSALALGAAGLAPFLALSVTAVWSPPYYGAFLIELLRAYAVVILVFVGAVHWGLAIRDSGVVSTGQLAWSVVPALVGWIVLFLPMLAALWLLAAGFVTAAAVDYTATRRGLTPLWYMRLRVPLTAVVVLSLLIAGLGQCADPVQ